MSDTRPRQITMHWMPESWGYYEAYWSTNTPASGHNCNDKCHEVFVADIEVPWCAEHDSPFYSVARFHADGNDCRLEESARYYVIGEAE